MNRTVSAESPRLGRRELLAGAAAATAALFVGPARGALDLLPFVGGSSQPFQRTMVGERLGETFRVVGGVADGSTLRLDAVLDLGQGATGMLEDQFVARFTGPVGLAQDTYEFATASFGRLPLFISPLDGPAGTPGVYEAIVNRWVPEWAQGGVR